VMIRWTRSNHYRTRWHQTDDGQRTRCHRTIPSNAEVSWSADGPVCQYCRPPEPLGPLQRDVYELVAHNLATTNQSVLAWLRIKYDVRLPTVSQTLSRLVKRGKIRRIARGVYRPCD
jgi:hypothetical protein